MAKYKVLYTKAAIAALKVQPAKRRERVKVIVHMLAANPFARHTNLDTIKGEKDAFRYRLGDWRLLYQLDRRAETLLVVDFRPRGRAYE